MSSRKKNLEEKSFTINLLNLASDLKKNSFSEILKINAACMALELVGFIALLVLHLCCFV